MKNLAFHLSCISWFLLVSMSAAVAEVGKFDLYSKSSHLGYIASQKQALENEIQSLKDQGKGTEAIWAYLNQPITRERDMLEAMGRKKDTIEPNTLERDQQVKLRLAALCEVSAAVKNVKAIALLERQFDVSTHFSLPVSLSSTRQFEQEQEKAKSLRDYPVLNLAMACGPEAIPSLRQIILNPEIAPRARMAAFAALYHIDQEKAEEVQTSLLNSFDADWRECFQQYLANPVLEPWKYPVPQNERVEKARLLHEFRTSKTDTK
ncbi:MAG TPA: hypothetical protein PLX83_14830 [bacterium]|nr:hypothetical protein [bacterium]